MRLKGLHSVGVAALVEVAADEANGDAHADREGLHEAFEVGDRRRDERVRQHDLLQDETAGDGKLRLRGLRVRFEEGEVHSREANEGQPEGEGEKHLELDVAGHVGRPDEDDWKGADAEFGEGIDGGDALPTGVLSKKDGKVPYLSASHMMRTNWEDRRGKNEKGGGGESTPTWSGHVVTSSMVNIVLASHLTTMASIDPSPHTALMTKVDRQSSHVRSISMVKTRKMRVTTEHLARHRTMTDRISEAKKLWVDLLVSKCSSSRTDSLLSM